MKSRQGRSTKRYITMNFWHLIGSIAHSPDFVGRGGKTAGPSETLASGRCQSHSEWARELRRKQHLRTPSPLHILILWLNLLSSGRSFSSASRSMFWHQPSILSTSVCRRRKKNSPSLMQGEARPESGRLRGPSRDGVPAQALSEVIGRGE